MADDVRMFQSRSHWRVSASEPKTWYEIVREEDSAFIIEGVDEGRKKRGPPKTESGIERRKRQIGLMLEYLDVPLFTAPSSKMQNAVRWLKLLEETGIRK